MTSAAIQDKSLSRRTAEFLDRAYSVTSDRSNSTSSAASLDAAEFTDSKSVGSSHTVVLPTIQVTFAEIFSYALPASAKVTKFISLIQDIRIARSSNTLAEHVDSKVSEAMYLLSDIVSTHWSEFSIEVKVLILDKFQHFNEKNLQSSYNSFYIASSTIKELRKMYTHYQETYSFEYNSFDRFTQVKMNLDVFANTALILWSYSDFKKVVQKSFKVDGFLLEENRESIERFSHSVKTILAGRQGMKKYKNTLIELAK